jgi:two-component system chemotaxis response regulator CheB
MSGKKLSVLLVDDSRTVLLQMEKTIAESEEAELVGTARNGAEAIKRASELNPDLVIMDIVMPEMDGLAALRMLQAKQPEIRVVMLSSVGGKAPAAEEAFRLGALQVLTKPVDEEILAALLSQERERLTSQSGS